MATILGSIYSWKFEDLARSPLLSQTRLKVFQPWMYLSSVTRLHEHRLRYQTLQPHAQKCATHSPRRTKVLCFLPDRFSEKPGRVNTPSPLANISSKTHSSPQIRCFHAKHQADPLFLLHDTVGHGGAEKACDTTTLSKCGCPRAKDLPNGSFGFLLWSLVWTAKSLAHVQKPATVIKEKAVYSKPSTPHHRSFRLCETWLPSAVVVCYLYQPGELEDESKRSHRSDLAF